MKPDSSFPSRLEERQRNKIICKHLILRPHLMGAIGRRVLQSDFFDQDPDLGFLVMAVCVYYEEFKTLPPLDVLCRELNDHWIELQQVKGRDPFPKEYLQRYREVLSSWYQETQFADDWCKQWLMDHLKRYEAQRLSSSLQGVDDLDRIEEIYQSGDDILQGDPFLDLSEETAWNDIWAAMSEDERMKLGCQFIDQALDGGLAPKECMLVVAPSGGGKTTLGMQLAAHRVAHRSHVVYLATEQALVGDMSIRQAMLGAQAPRSLLKQGKRNAPPELLRRLEAVQKEWKEYFHFIDCRKTRKAKLRIEDLFTPVDGLLKIGKKVDLVILDWWGRLRSRMLMNLMARSDAQSRNAASDWLDTLIQGIKDRNSRLLVLHQVKGAAAGRGPKAKITTHDAQEDSNLNNLFEFGFAFGKLDSDNRARVNCDKARSTARTTGYLQLDGDYGKFRTVDPTTMDFTELGKSSITASDVSAEADLREGQA